MHHVCLGTLLEVNDLVELGWLMTNPQAINGVILIFPTVIFLVSFHVILFFVINLVQLG